MGNIAESMTNVPSFQNFSVKPYFLEGINLLCLDLELISTPSMVKFTLRNKSNRWKRKVYSLLKLR